MLLSMSYQLKPTFTMSRVGTKDKYVIIILKQWSPTFLAPGTDFVEYNFFTDPACEGFGMIQTHYIYCALFLLILHQLHLRSSGIRSGIRSLGTPV